MNSRIKVSLPQVVGKGYGTFWRFKGRYRVCKGSRASKKSTTTALWVITNMMAYPEANTLVIRKVYRTLKDSCFAQLKWAIHHLQVDGWWEVKESPLEMTYIPTGQKIFFRGLDDPQKITSMTAEHGTLCWCWIEEAYELSREDDFNILDESIRGGSGVFKQITLTFNPWNERSWLKRRFFDAPDSADKLAVTTNYLCNEWLDDADRKVFEKMKADNPRRYQVAGLGNWGIVEGLVYETWKEEEFSLAEIRKKYSLESVFGLDFGYTNDPTALFAGFANLEQRKLFVWDELYERGLSNREICGRIRKMGYGKESITADSAEPKSIDELKGFGLRVHAAKKGKDSVNAGIQFLQDFEIIVHPRCVNFLTEISNYTWDKDRFGRALNTPVDDFNHLMDAMRYGMEKYMRKRSGGHLQTFRGGY